MKVLFIGGTGIISSACAPLAIEMGYDLYLLNRSQSTRPTPAGAKVINADIRKPEAMAEALGNHTFDAVVQWIAYHPSQIEDEIKFFRNRIKQYVFISSASAYQTPAEILPIRESTPLYNPHWAYSRNKIACEEALLRAYREDKFPFTVVRPSHTYDARCLPFDHGYTVVDRMLKGQPVVVHGDGSSLWTLTHHKDFAKGFVPLLGESRAIGESFHITSDEWLSWNKIYEIVASAFGTEANLVHVPSEVIAQVDQSWGAGLLGDKTNSSIFDNSKIKSVVPGFKASISFSQGAQEIAEYFNSHPEARDVSKEAYSLQERLIEWAKRPVSD